MNEIGFQRSHERSLPADEFACTHDFVALHELTAAAEGLVQMEAEQAVLRKLRHQLDELLTLYNSEHVLVVESEHGRNYPKLHEKMTTIVVEGENKLYFQRTVDPPLRIGVYVPRQH